VVFRIQVIIEAAALGLPVSSGESNYIELQGLGGTMSDLESVLSVFVVMCLLRALKFLRLLPFTGPSVQSIMDVSFLVKKFDMQ
jgi:hypothetical protein